MQTNNLKSKVEVLLSSNQKWKNENGELKLLLLAEAINNYDTELLEILLKDEELKKSIFCSDKSELCL